MATVRAVVFDYGGVLTTPVRDSIAAWLERDGIDPGSFSRTLKSWLSRSAPAGTPIHRLETGELTAEEFDEIFAAELTLMDGSPVPRGGLLSGLFADMRPDPAMFALIEELRDAGLRVGLLSNSWGNIYPRERLDALFDPVVISGEVGMRKPNTDIFYLTLDRLALPADQVVFVDDAEPNVEGAARIGLHTIWHTDAVSTRTELARFVTGIHEVA
ncbi:HAD family phosphatase [Microtetraspora sp. NBRC 16547]|uniref:HAD family hydrolase n=1 Tax=Microtetraspora sp. NBRC 16547 TaxID=3030993 RepID=UPI002557AD86|nr:HAD family phosphatase [Microtetraspora sp. NBRC 16547]